MRISVGLKRDRVSRASLDRLKGRALLSASLGARASRMPSTSRVAHAPEIIASMRAEAFDDRRTPPPEGSGIDDA